MDIIVCIDKNNGIGKDGGLLFRIPEDMAYFRRMTVNKTVIMGRKTLESLPGGRPLKNRRNIVLTRNRDRVPDGADAVSSIDELKRAIGSDKAFVIGGGKYLCDAAGLLRKGVCNGSGSVRQCRPLLPGYTEHA